jgi:hypothetical protein
MREEIETPRVLLGRLADTDACVHDPFSDLDLQGLCKSMDTALDELKILIFGGVLQACNRLGNVPRIPFCSAIEFDTDGIFGELEIGCAFYDGYVTILFDLFVQNEGLHVDTTLVIATISCFVEPALIGMLVTEYTSGHILCGIIAPKERPVLIPIQSFPC